MVTRAPQSKPNPSGSSLLHRDHVMQTQADLGAVRLPQLKNTSACLGFISLDSLSKRFFPPIKAHTSVGQELRTVSQTQIHFASKDCRLRSDHLAQTLWLFGHKAARCLPEGFCVQVDLSPHEGAAACDTVTLIHYSASETAQAILEQHYAPFNGGGIGWMVPSDDAKNTVLKLEERLFYYKTLLAIKTAIDNRLSLRSVPA